MAPLRPLRMRRLRLFGNGFSVDFFFVVMQPIVAHLRHNSYTIFAYIEDMEAKKKNLVVADRLNALHSEVEPLALDALRSTGRALVVLPTGTGKTRLALNIARAFLPPKKKLFILSHRTAINDQTLEVYRAHWPGATVGLFDGPASLLRYDIIVATIQSASKPYTLSAMDKKRIGLVVVDECHRAPSNEYARWLKWAARLPHLGLTATALRPDDGDGTLVTAIFGEPCYAMSIEEAIERRIYASPHAESRLILTDSFLNGAVSKAGEWGKKALEHTWTSVERNALIVKAYEKYGRGACEKKGVLPKAILFCINVKHALRMREVFRKALGVRVELVVGDGRVQSPKERASIIETFRSTHEIEILCAVMILTEGIDIPDANIVMMARPTRSNIVYTQQLGRGARWLDKTKEDFIVLDFVDNATKGFVPYTLSNVTDRPYERKNIITEYLANPDRVEVEERVDVLAAIKGWELAAKSPKEWKAEIVANFMSTGEWPTEGDKLCARFRAYRRKNSGVYDAAFAKQVRDLGYASVYDKAEKAREELLRLAKNGEGRPSKGSRLGRSLNALNKRCHALAVDLRKIRPDWFPDLRVAESKQKLISLAEENSNVRPSGRLRSNLCNYLNKNNCRYDPEFAEKMKALAPIWLPKPRRTGAARQIVNLDTGIIYDGDRTACAAIGKNKRAVAWACRKGQRAGGYRWAYVDDQELKTKEKK